MKKIIFVICLFCFWQANGMNNSMMENDSLKGLGYEQLERKFYQHFDQDKNISLIYAKAYLKRAKQIGNNLSISKGYYMIIKASNRQGMLIYSDSIIDHDKKSPNTYYTGIGYYLLGTRSYLENNTPSALEQFMIADSILSKTDTILEKYWVKQAIGLLKMNSKDYDGALKEFRTSINYYEKIEAWESYASNAFSIYTLYVEKNQLDSAAYFVDKAYDLIKNKNVKMKVRLEYAKGVIEFKKGNLNNSIDLFRKSSQNLDSIGDHINHAFSESYLGESHLRNNDTLNGIFHLENAASYFKTKNLTHSGVRSAIKTLTICYRRRNDLRKELENLKILISVDSINAMNRITLKDELYKNYDLPNSIKRKNEIIQEINTSSSRKSSYLSAAVLVIGAFIVWVIVLRRRNKKKIKLYKQIIEDYKNHRITKQISNPQSKIPKKDIDLLTAAFKKYEKELYFTKSEFNKEFVRKETGINSHYIADYLRDFVGSSFSQYVNNKRIELAITKILEDGNYSKYTMEAMGEEVGYNNSGTFKRAFKQRTGLTPLEFIKKSDNS